MNKRLKLFENFNSRENFANKISSVFSDIEDDPKWEDSIEIESDDYINEENDSIHIYFYFYGESDTFDNYFDSVKKKYELLNRIQSCVKHLLNTMDKEMGIDFLDDGEAITLSLFEIQTSGEFWKKSEDGIIHIDLKSLHKILNLPNYVKINMTYAGREKYNLELKFNNEEQLRNFDADNLNNELKKLEIEGKELTGKVYNGHNEVDYYKTTINYEYKVIFGLNTDIRFSD